MRNLSGSRLGGGFVRGEQRGGGRLRPDASEVERLWAATDKAKALTDWKPQYSGREGFQRGLTETIAWFKDPRNLEGYDPSRYQV